MDMPWDLLLATHATIDIDTNLNQLNNARKAKSWTR